MIDEDSKWEDLAPSYVSWNLTVGLEGHHDADGKLQGSYGDTGGDNDGV